MNNRYVLAEIQRNVEQLQCAMMIDLHGNILEYSAQESFFTEMMSFDELEYVAKIVSLRFHIVDFHKILHGLEITINVFSDCVMAVTSLNENILVVIVTRGANQMEICSTVLQIKNRVQSAQTMLSEERGTVESFDHGK